MIKNYRIIAVLILLVPFLSGCSLVDNFKKEEGFDKKLDESIGTSVKIIESTSTEKVVPKNNSDFDGVTSSSTEKKLIKNVNKNNSMDKFDTNKQYVATVQTSLGDFTIDFNKGETPKTVENFVTLAEKGFYDNTIFHRVIKGFMIQGGDPVGNGTGGPGYKFADEKFSGEYVRGAVAMANSGPNTNGSQFFVMHVDYPLPKNYTIFGKVSSGMDTIDKIAESKVSAGVFGENSTPVVPTVIKSVKISVK